MTKLIITLCIFFQTIAYSAEYQRINFNDYSKKIAQLASECTAKGMPHFNGLCLSKKYDDQSRTSITIALQITSFELFYKKCEHTDSPEASYLLTKALNIEETKRFIEEMKPQKEALETYSNHFDYCKSKDENNSAVLKKLKWFDYMINKHSKNLEAQQPQDVPSESSGNDFPEYFIGTFKNIVPKKIGGTIPDTKFLLTCNKFGVCSVQIGENVAGKYNSFLPVANLQYASNALLYAKEHKNVAVNSALLWQANNLKPLLSSSSAIETCIDLRDQSLPQEYMLLCKLDHDPWAKNTVLLMGTTMSNCGELFCRYEIFPLFRE